MTQMLVTCIEGFYQDELTKFNAGLMKRMPKRILEEFKEFQHNATDRVKAFDGDMFLALQNATRKVVNKIEEDRKNAQPPTFPIWLSLPLSFGFLAVIGLLGYKFVLMYRELSMKGEKSKK